MPSKYLNYIADEHLLSCIEQLFNAYSKAKSDIDKRKFYNNKIDPIKLTFDSKFNSLGEELLLKAEIARQIDKTINNAIGIFHEDILGGIRGFEKGNKSGFDIKAIDNSLFADIKNKHNTMNSSSSESLYQKLQDLAEKHSKSKCYWVAIWSNKSYNEEWEATINGKAYSHKRVYKVSGDQFYKLLSGQENALFELYEILPTAIDDFLKKQGQNQQSQSTAITEISYEAKHARRNILNQIAYDNFGYYLGFDRLR